MLALLLLFAADAAPTVPNNAPPMPPPSAPARPPAEPSPSGPKPPPPPVVAPVQYAEHSGFGWGGLGFYNASSTSFIGLNAGAAEDLINLNATLPLSVFGNVALAFGNGGTLLPLSGGLLVHYDQPQYRVAGGACITVVPNTFGSAGTPLGLGIMGLVTYPVPQVAPGLSLQAQIQYHFLSDDFSMFVFDVGGALGF